MEKLTGYFLYPSTPKDLPLAARNAKQSLATLAPSMRLDLWEENDVPGRFLITPIKEHIDSCDFVVADISKLNFNVIYEIGFAIARKKRLVLLRNPAISFDLSELREVGIFDTIGYATYENSTQIAQNLSIIDSLTPLLFNETEINQAAPVFVVDTFHKTEQSIRIFSRIKKARLFFRSFDPREEPRLSAADAIEHVRTSLGVVVPLLPGHHADARKHNLRSAFIAGLADGMGKVLLVLQEGNEPVPLDYRDLVSSYTFPNQIDDYISRFATDVMADLQTSSRLAIREPGTFLSTLNLGAVSAENEFRDLGQYYLRTDEFRRALRGEARIVVGRKGSGKTALFAQLRDILRDDRGNVVLDLKPEAYQLKKFKEETLALMAEGTQEHTLTAFWEYLLVLEICFKLLEKDALPHVRDHRLYEPYRRLAELYNSDEYVTEGDFSERLAKILQSISFEHKSKHGTNPGVKLNDAQLTEMLYRHDYAVLRDSVIDYLKLKNEVWILIDNLDKGWATHGVDDDDLRMIRCLLEASRKLDREMAKADVACHAMIFIRNDVYELLVAKTPDRGKEARLPLDWNDGDLLRELLRRRLIYNEGVERKASFDEIWRSICASHIRGEETSQYIIDRSLMRPRYLLNFVNQAKSHAVNLGKDKIEPEDIEKGESIYSTDLVTDISYEINDVFPKAGDILYEFLEWEMDIQHDYLLEIVREKGFDNGDIQKLVDMLLWFGFIGLVRENGEASYIHDVNYDFRRLATLIERRKKVGVVYRINPAFWAGLEVTRHKAS